MPLADGDIIQIVDRPKDVLPSLVLYAVLFAAIFAINCVIIGTSPLMKSIVSHGRMAIMMQPSILLTCFTLVACFAGHADASFYYSEGLCLNVADGQTGSNGCTANDVSATVTNYTGPSTCELGGPPIVGNITTSIKVTSNERYDIGVYIGLNGADAQTDTRTNACLVQTLGQIDATNNIFDLDSDSCLDANQGNIVGFQIENFEIACESTSEIVTISACFAWDQKKDTNCPTACVGQSNSSLHDKCLRIGTGSVSSDNPLFSNQKTCSALTNFFIFSVKKHISQPYTKEMQLC